MPKPLSLHGEKNLISQRLIALRKERGLSQRDLAQKLQLAGYDMDRNVITRIETIKNYQYILYHSTINALASTLLILSCIIFR